MEQPAIFKAIFIGFMLLSKAAWGQSVVLSPADDNDSSSYDLPQLLNDSADHEYSWTDEALDVKTEKVKGNNISLQASYDHNNSLSIKGNYREKPLTDMANLTGLQAHRGAWNLRFDSSLRESHFNLYGEWDFGTFDPEAEYGINETQQMYKMGFKGKLGHFSYGAKHRSTGRDHKSLIKEKDSKDKIKSDKADNEIWGAWWYDKIGIKTSFSEVWNNLENNPNKPRLTTTQAGITLNYLLSSWPYLGYSLSYSQGTRQSSDEPVNYKPHQDPIEEVATGLSYSGKVWNASLYSSYTKTKDSLRAGKLPTATWTHDLSASYYPTSTLSITPALGYYIEDYSQFDTETVTRSASTTFSYAPKDKNYKFEVFGSFDAVTNRTWGQDTENFYLGNSLVWSLPESSPLEMKNLSLHTTYNRYRNAIHSHSNSDDLAVWLIFSIQPPSGLRLMPISFF